MSNISLNNKDNKFIFDIFIILAVFALLLRFAIAIGYINFYDTSWYRGWALSLPDGLFDIYSRAAEIDLDYPPVYLLFLYVTGIIYRAVGTESHVYIYMLLMKFWPVIFDFLCGAVLYFVFKSKGRLIAMASALLWWFNPATIFNSSFWGQTDSMMCLLLLLSFARLENGLPFRACFWFALAGLTKFQSLFFVPVFLLELFLKYRVKAFLKGLGIAAATVFGVFLPFMAGSKNLFLFFDVYLKGQGKYPYCTLSAFNIFGALGLNWVDDLEPVFGSVSVQAISAFAVILIFLGLITLYLFSRRKSVWISCFLFMNSLFMFTSRMHERYQFVVLVFILAAAVIHKRREFYYIFAATGVMVFINQLIPMFSWNQTDSWFANNYGALIIAFSFVNLAVYVVSVYYCLRFMFSYQIGFCDTNSKNRSAAAD